MTNFFELKTRYLEIACFNLESALLADKAGADRIELCDDFSVGGITPEFSVAQAAKRSIKTALFVMIRPRGGDFVYTDKEFLEMKKSLLQLKELNVDGFVFGIVHSDGSIDKERNLELVKLASPKPCSFHRAFDKAQDSFEALEIIIELGFKTILTSGTKQNAMDGIDVLSELTKLANDRIVIMPGGGVRSSNIEMLKEKLNTSWFHSSAVKQNDLADAEEIKLLMKKLV